MDKGLFNEEQLEVIDTLDRNILLVASAGTGKTNTMAGRIANILEKKLARPEEILCLTFTNKACAEMKERITATAGETGLKIVAKTIHSFCYDIIRAEAKNSTDYFSDFIIFDEEDCLSLVKNVIQRIRAKYSGCRFNPRPLDMLGVIGVIKEACMMVGTFTDDRMGDYRAATGFAFSDENFASRLDRLCEKAYRTVDFELREFIEEHGAEIVFDYDNMLAGAHGLDFNDLIMGACRLLNDASVRKKWQGRFRFINVDEMQDTSETEYDILTQVFGSSNILFCGDYFQTIYEWRGSNPELVRKRYVSRYRPKEIIFYKNYRSTRTLLKASYDWLCDRFPGEVQKIYSDRVVAASADEGEKIVVSCAENITDEAYRIYREIQRLDPQDLSRVCVLVRTNNYAKELSGQLGGMQKLDGRSLDFLLVDEFRFFRRMEIKDAIAFLKLLVNRHDFTSLARIIEKFIPGVSRGTIDKITSEEYLKNGIRLTDYLDPVTQKYDDPYELLLQALDSGRVVVFDVESTGTDTTEDEIIQIAAVRLAPDGSIKEEFMKYVKPSKSVGSAELVHHISDEMLAETGEDPRKVFAEFNEFVHGDILVGHNVTYDISILTSQMGRLGMEPVKYEAYYDTLEIFRRYYPNLKNHKLEYLGERFKVSHKSSHDAFDDICATAEILVYAVNKNIRPSTDIRRKCIKAYKKYFTEFAEKLENLRKMATVKRPYELLGIIVNDFGVKDYYSRQGQRLENLRDLYRHALEYDAQNKAPMDSLQDLLKLTALSNSQIDLMLKKKPRIPIITVHQAKGTEFDYVFVAGLSVGIFPVGQNGDSDEEARLFYVAMTRAKKKLYLSWIRSYRNREKTESDYLYRLSDEYLKLVK